MKKIFIAFILLLMNSANAQIKMDITEQLINCTIKINSIKDGKLFYGSGFFYKFNIDGNEVPVIITNRHVVDGFSQLQLFFKKKIDDKPEYGPAYIVNLNNVNNTSVILHPNKLIDLAIIPIYSVLSETQKQNISLFYIPVIEDLIPNKTEEDKFQSIEKIFMIGYPNGLWDERNNLPIVREGITATSLFIDYNGKREFMIDIAAFGGSSGSPIFYYTDNYTERGSNTHTFDNKLYLLGIIYSGPLYNYDGEIIKQNPEQKIADIKSNTNITMNLGYVIKSSEILEFNSVLRNLITNSKQFKK